MNLVVADSSPLMALASSGHLDILFAIVREIVVPETVFQECIVNKGKPGASDIRDAVVAGRIQKVADPEIGVFGNIEDLDIGEALALSLATIMKSPILIDDQIGREVAMAHNIGVIGGSGILLQAKKQGLILKVEPIIKTWMDVIGYRLSDALVAKVLAMAGETEHTIGRDQTHQDDLR